MKTMQISKFKEQCLKLVENLDSDGIILLKRGKPIAKVIPIQNGKEALIGSLKGKIKISDDIFSTEVKWNAES